MFFTLDRLTKQPIRAEEKHCQAPGGMSKFESLSPPSARFWYIYKPRSTSSMPEMSRRFESSLETLISIIFRFSDIRELFDMTYKRLLIYVSCSTCISESSIRESSCLRACSQLNMSINPMNSTAITNHVKKCDLNTLKYNRQSLQAPSLKKIKYPNCDERSTFTGEGGVVESDNSIETLI